MFNWQTSALMPGDQGIKQTVAKIKQAVIYAFNDGSVRKRAEEIIASCPERDSECEVSKIFKYASDHFRYTRDPRGVEMVKSPEVADAEISRLGFFLGDCDDISAYLAALLYSVGYPVRFATISVQGKGDTLRHIYPEVFAVGKWIALEATARQHSMGWEPPYGRKLVFEL